MVFYGIFFSLIFEILLDLVFFSVFLLFRMFEVLYRQFFFFGYMFFCFQFGVCIYVLSFSLGISVFLIFEVGSAGFFVVLECFEFFLFQGYYSLLIVWDLVCWFYYIFCILRVGITVEFIRVWFLGCFKNILKKEGMSAVF